MGALRDYVLKCVDEGSVEVIDDAVDCDQIAHRTAVEEQGENRPLLFRSVSGYQADVVANLFGHHQRMAEALLAADLPDLFRRVEDAIAHPAPLKAGRLAEGEYDVVDEPVIPSLIPQLRYSQHDATPYLTSAIAVARDTTEERHHICFVRMAVVGGSTLLFNAATPNIRRIVETTVGRGEELEVSILIGPPVEIILVACLSLPGTDKLGTAQALSGGRLAFSLDGVPFPLQSEYVLRARVVPKYHQDGPFGDLLGLYSVKEKSPECHVSQAICRRRPLYHSVMAGRSREHAELLAMGARLFLDRIKRKNPGVLDCQVPAFGVGRVALIRVAEGFRVEEVASELWSIPIVRLIVVVNEDVDVSSSSDILWALTQRARHAADFRFEEREDSLFKESKLIVDASVPELGSWRNRRIRVFGE